MITVDHGSWDHHTWIGQPDNGNLRRMADEFALSLAAFLTDLGPLASRVTVVTLSEFGRRVKENANQGLDHGYGNVMFLVGAGVTGGASSRRGHSSLFGRTESLRRWVPTSECLFHVFSGSALTVDESWHRPLVAVAEEVLARLAPHNSESEIEVDLQRVAVQRLPTAVIREIVANALTHRDYTVNAPIVVQLKGQTFEVISPGGFRPECR